MSAINLRVRVKHTILTKNITNRTLLLTFATLALINFHVDTWTTNRLWVVENYFNSHISAKGGPIAKSSWAPKNFFLNLVDPMTTPPQVCECEALVHCESGVGKPGVGTTRSWGATQLSLFLAFDVILALHIHAILRPVNYTIHQYTYIHIDLCKYLELYCGVRGPSHLLHLRLLWSIKPTSTRYLNKSSLERMTVRIVILVVFQGLSSKGINWLPSFSLRWHLLSASVISFENFSK